MENRSQTRAQHSRQAILDTAHDLFLKQGFAATSVRQIAEGAGLALGGIYNHFPSKEAIFSELTLQHHPYRQVVPLLLQIPTKDIEEFVRQAAGVMVSELGRQPDFIKLMLIEMVEFSGRDMPRVMKEAMQEVLPLIQRFDHDALRPIPPFILFRAFLGLFFSYYMTEIMLAGTPAASANGNALEHFIDIFLHGILKREAAA